MRIVGVVGTAKNTGKTTTIAALLRAGRAAGLRIALTGIGYDGEEIDTVTSLPKPRLYLEREIIVATSQRCLRTSTAGYEPLRSTPFRTPLGPISIVRVTSPGLMVVAGPNKRTDLDALTILVRDLSPDLFLIDGSLNRLAPLADAETLIFTTGASRSTDLIQLSEEMHAIESIVALPVHPGEGELPPPIMNSLLDDDDATMLANRIAKGTTLFQVPGMVSASALHKLNSGVKSLSEPVTVVIHSPVTCLLAGDPLTTASLLEESAKQRIHLRCARPLGLAGITVNPFYPLYRQQTYSPAYVDKSALLLQMRSRLRSPVFNIKDEGAGELLRRCLR